MTSWKDRRVLVTGGAGFIGHRLVLKLVDEGAEVIVADDLSKGKEANLRPVIDKIDLLRDDLLQDENAKAAMKRVEVCFHLAARIGGIGYFHKTPALSLRDNTIITLNLWDAAVQNDTEMVYLSSSMVFERTSNFPTSETAIRESPPPLTGYGFSKLTGEYIATTYYEQFGTKYLIVRPFNAYGPGEVAGDYPGYAHVIPDLAQKALSGQYPLEILGAGNQIRSYTYVDDIADAILFLTERTKNDDFNIGTGRETRVIDLARMIWSLCGRKEKFAVTTLPGYQYDVQKRVPDITKIRSMGWTPKVPLEQGLASTVEWVRARRSRSS